jgi:hypothetical protein
LRPQSFRRLSLRTAGRPRRQVSQTNILVMHVLYIMLERYTVSNIHKIRKKPWLVRSEAKKWLIEFNKYINSIDKLSRLRRDYVSQNASEPVANEDWDNLIILDACRYDVFKRIVSQIDSDHTLKKGNLSQGAPRSFY